MSKLQLSVAVGNYDRCRPLFDGDVQIDGVDPVFMRLSPEEIFFRAFRHAEFDICELSLSSSTVKAANGTLPYVGVPAFLSRMFRHSAFYVRKDRITRPEDLKGKRVGLPEYQLTAMVWIRAFLEQDYGVAPEDITWVRGGISDADRPEKIKLDLPEGIRLIDAPAGKTISQLLAEGEIDGYIAPRAPDVPAGTPNIGWLFDDPLVEAMSYYKRRQIFPIMHILGVRKAIADAHPWLPGAVLKAFTQAKDQCLEHLRETSACKITMPFVDERLHADMALMGRDFWTYGIEQNRHVLEDFFAQHHRQGHPPASPAPARLIHRQIAPTQPNTRPSPADAPHAPPTHRPARRLWQLESDTGSSSVDDGSGNAAIFNSTSTSCCLRQFGIASKAASNCCRLETIVVLSQRAAIIGSSVNSSPVMPPTVQVS